MTTLITAAKETRGSTDFLVLDPRRTQLITGSAFRIFFRPNWQINNGFFNRPIMARTQILVNSWDPEQGFPR